MACGSVRLDTDVGGSVRNSLAAFLEQSAVVVRCQDRPTPETRVLHLSQPAPNLTELQDGACSVAGSCGNADPYRAATPRGPLADLLSVVGRGTVGNSVVTQ